VCVCCVRVCVRVCVCLREMCDAVIVSYFKNNLRETESSGFKMCSNIRGSVNCDMQNAIGSGETRTACNAVAINLYPANVEYMVSC
jgi:hypothetical protein